MSTLRMLTFMILLQRQNCRGEKKKKKNQTQSLPGAKSEMSKMEGLSTKGRGGIWGRQGWRAPVL